MVVDSLDLEEIHGVYDPKKGFLITSTYFDWNSSYKCTTGIEDVHIKFRLKNNGKNALSND